VTEQNLGNFWLLVLICNLSTFLPLLFINWIPEDDPQVLEETTAQVNLAVVRRSNPHGVLSQASEVDIKSGLV